MQSLNRFKSAPDSLSSTPNQPPLKFNLPTQTPPPAKPAAPAVPFPNRNNRKQSPSASASASASASGRAASQIKKPPTRYGQRGANPRPRNDPKSTPPGDSDRPGKTRT
ncbi:hypothetical protein NL676_025328 [Syzygium grande]|nr:hypothetical protein NL676_025328 [Syzygium grande]